MVAGDLSSSTAYKRETGWNMFIDTIHHWPISLQYATRIFVIYTYLHMHSHANTHLQISWRPRVSVFGADKDTDLIRSSVAWIILSCLDCWKEHIAFSQPGLLAVIFLSFLCSAQLSCWCLCFSFAYWVSQKQTSGFLFIPHFVRIRWAHFSVPQQPCCPLSFSNSSPPVGTEGLMLIIWLLDPVL